MRKTLSVPATGQLILPRHFFGFGPTQVPLVNFHAAFSAVMDLINESIIHMDAGEGDGGNENICKDSLDQHIT